MMSDDLKHRQCLRGFATPGGYTELEKRVLIKLHCEEGNTRCAARYVHYIVSCTTTPGFLTPDFFANCGQFQAVLVFAGRCAAQADAGESCGRVYAAPGKSGAGNCQWFVQLITADSG